MASIIFGKEWQREKLAQAQKSDAFTNPIVSDILKMHCTLDIFKAIGSEYKPSEDIHQTPITLKADFLFYLEACHGCPQDVIKQFITPLNQFQLEASGNIGWLDGYLKELKKYSLFGIRFDHDVIFRYFNYADDLAKWVGLNHKLMTARENVETMSTYSSAYESTRSTKSKMSCGQYAVRSSDQHSVRSSVRVPFTLKPIFGQGTEVFNELAKKISIENGNNSKNRDDDEDTIMGNNVEDETLDGNDNGHPWKPIPTVDEDVQFRVRMVYDGVDKLLDVSKSLKEIHKMISTNPDPDLPKTFYGIIFHSGGNDPSEMKQRMDACDVPYKDLRKVDQNKEVWKPIVTAYNNMKADEYGVLLVEGNFIEPLINLIDLDYIQYIRINDVPTNKQFMADLINFIRKKRSVYAQEHLYVDIIANYSDAEQAKKALEFCTKFDLEAPKLLDQIAQGTIMEKITEPDDSKYDRIPLRDLIKKRQKLYAQERKAYNLKQPKYEKPKKLHFFSKDHFEWYEGDHPYCRACLKRGNHYTRYCKIGGSLRGIKQGEANQEGEKLGGPLTRCFCCYQSFGHNSSQCPYRHPKSFGSEYRCWNCSSPLHRLPKCPKGRRIPSPEKGPVLPPGEARRIVNGKKEKIGINFPSFRQAQYKSKMNKEERRAGMHY